MRGRADSGQRTGGVRMRITVFGATGGIGGHVVRQALDAGQKVTAVVRTSSAFERPPKLNSKALTGRYRTVVGGTVSRGYLISRADVAHLMLAVLDDPATICQPVGVAY